MQFFVERPAATGVGSMPGTDPLAATRLVADELPELPHLVELPARGPGAGMIGRTAALLVDLAVDLQPAGWRLVDRPGADLRRATAFLRQDLDVLEEVFDGYDGALKLQVVGPWTLAAQLEKTRGDKVLSDHGARRDLAESLVEGVVAHVSEVGRRVPGARVVLQVDEPNLPVVLAGGVPTVSGFGRLRAVDETEAETAFRRLVEAAAVPVVVHCCAPDVPTSVLRRAGVAAVGFDSSIYPATGAHRDALAEAAEAGLSLVCGVVPSLPASPSSGEPAGSVGGLRAQVAALWNRLDQPPDRLSDSVVVAPACGLAGASPAYAVAALRRTRAVARALDDDPAS